MKFVIRPLLWPRVGSLLAWVLLAVVQTVGSWNDPAWQRSLACAGGVCLLAVAVRSWLLRVEDLGATVLVVNWTRTSEFACTEVDRFIDNGGVVTLQLVDGQHIGLSAFPAPFRDLFAVESRRNAPAVADLEARRKAHHRRKRRSGR